MEVDMSTNQKDDLTFAPYNSRIENETSKRDPELFGYFFFKMYDKKTRKDKSKLYIKEKFAILENQIFQVKESEKHEIIGVMDFSLAKFKKIKSSNTSADEIGRVGFILSRNNSKAVFITQNQVQAQQWEDYLLKYVIQSKIEKNYQMEKVLGEGTSGKVYLALSRRNRDLNTKVAIKVMSKQRIQESLKGISRVINEIKVHWALQKCETLLRLLEIYEDKEHIYLVLEYLKKGNLTEIFTENHKFKEDQVKFIMEQMLLAIDFIHSKNIIHRDIKLDNTLVGKIDDQLYEVKIADFGLAIFTPNDELVLEKCGTPGNVGPEVLTDNGYSYKADIFSLGAVFFNLITGRYLFQGDDAAKILKNNLVCKLNYIDRYLSHVSQDCKNLLQLMLSKSPKNRPTATEALRHSWFNSDQSVLNKLLVVNINLTKQLSRDSSQYSDSLKSFSSFQVGSNYFSRVNQNQQSIFTLNKRNTLQANKSQCRNQSSEGSSQKDYQSVNFYRALRESRSQSSLRIMNQVSQNIQQTNIQVSNMNKSQFYQQMKTDKHSINYNQQAQDNSKEDSERKEAEEKSQFNNDENNGDEHAKQGEAIEIFEINDEQNNVNDDEVIHSDQDFIMNHLNITQGIQMQMSQKNIVQRKRIFL